MDIKRVLVVEDDPSTARVIAAILREEPYRLLWASSIDTALDLARFHRPDAILLSWTLSEMNGDEFAELLDLWPETANIPLILMSLEPWLFEAHTRAKAVQVLNKDDLYTELAPRVRDALAIPQENATPEHELARFRDRTEWWNEDDAEDWRTSNQYRRSA